jgi:penicillin-binding protein 1A
MLRILFRVTAIGALGGFLGLLGVLAWWLRDLPPLRALEEIEPAASSVLLDRQGQILAIYSREHREPVRLSELPTHLLLAVRAAEDWSFYEHFGVDFPGLARALLRNLRGGRVLQGGSTITQQLTKKLLLTSDRTLRRKVRELVLALEIEQTYSKDQILELYLNTIYLGQGAYGVKTAAQTYFQKAPAEMTLAECALLAGLIRSPSLSDPVAHPERALRLRNGVLARMLERGAIEKPEHDAAVREAIQVRRQRPTEPRALDFAEAVRREMVLRVGADRLYSGGLRVETTLDPEVQRIAEAALEDGLKKVETRLALGRERGASEGSGRIQGAVLVQDLESGDILAMVGGRDRPGDPHGFNRALQAKRQPGSLFKPFVYAAALDNGLTGATVVEDVPLELLDARGAVEWAPQNYDERHVGPITLRSALVHSRNIVAVRTLNTLGLEVVRDYAQRMGVTSPLPPFLSLALGAGEVTLYEMVTAYTCFMTGGVRVEPRAIRLATNRRGALVLHGSPRRRQVLSPTTAYRMAHMLHDAVERGTGQAAAVQGLWVAGKTGTTNDSTDAWFIGAAPPLMVGVWVGFDEPRRMGRETGGGAAAPVFRQLLERLSDRFEFRPPQRPDGLEDATIDSDTGLESNARCQRIERELFLPGQKPGPCFH